MRRLHVLTTNTGISAIAPPENPVVALVGIQRKCCFCPDSCPGVDSFCRKGCRRFNGSVLYQREPDSLTFLMKPQFSLRLARDFREIGKDPATARLSWKLSEEEIDDAYKEVERRGARAAKLERGICGRSACNGAKGTDS